MPTAEQKANAEGYRDAAVQHAAVSRELYESGRFAESNYLAGLSVECILRGYRLMSDPEFDSRHDLTRLGRLSRIGDFVPKGEVIVINAALGDVINLWSNDHRFLDDVGLRKRWTKRKLYEGIKGDFVKELVRRLVNASNQIVAIGAARWKSCFKS